MRSICILAILCLLNVNLSVAQCGPGTCPVGADQTPCVTNEDCVETCGPFPSCGICDHGLCRPKAACGPDCRHVDATTTASPSTSASTKGSSTSSMVINPGGTTESATQAASSTASVATDSAPTTSVVASIAPTTKGKIVDTTTAPAIIVTAPATTQPLTEHVNTVTKSSGSPLTTGDIIGIVIGAVAALLIIIVAITRRKKVPAAQRNGAGTPGLRTAEAGGDE